MKTKNQRVVLHSNVAQSYGMLAKDFENRIVSLKKLIASRVKNPHPTSSEQDDMNSWQKYATEYRDEERRHLLAKKVCGNEFVLVRQTSY